jgi:hypothetical protein
MGNYSKFIGSIVGGVLGIFAAKGIIPADSATPDNINTILAGVGALATIGSAIATFLFPANKK